MYFSQKNHFIAVIKLFGLYMERDEYENDSLK